MVGEFLYAWLAGLLLPLSIGWPIAVWLGYREGLRAFGMAAAIGLSVLLIVCRAVQVWFPIGQATFYMGAGYAVLLVACWLIRDVRHKAKSLIQKHGSDLALLGLVMAVLAVALNAPLLFKGVIQFEGSRNADSFTFVNNARYMLGHAFYGAPDFSPDHPIFTIARSYFGDGAIQPRPGGEGFLAWLSGLWGADPMYFYNGLQTAGILLGGLSVLVFVPMSPGKSSSLAFAPLAALALGCPTLLFVAINSNFANGMTLAAGTAYVGLGLVERTRASFIAALVFLGCLMSGYSELMVFVGLIRFLSVVGEGFSGSGIRSFLRETGMLLLEVLVACLLLPWAAKATFVDYVTTLGISHANASDQVGNMYAGVPLAVAALAFLWIVWRDLGPRPDGSRTRALLVSVLVAFGLAQLLMMARGYSYGGFKISEYFVTSLVGVVVACAAVVLAKRASDRPERKSWHQAGGAVLAILLAVACFQDVRMIKRSWEFANDRQVMPDLVVMGQWMRTHVKDDLIAMGPSPSSFYYGHWVPYVTDMHMVYDWRGGDAAGYLSPYLKLAETHHYADATWMLSIDDIANPRVRQASDIAAFGRVHLSRAVPTLP
ncbi:hypothetical protein [Dyella caseinilytica]|uniref:4-amino-4-deoxy-L-arabinose transferase-like glycosyltransferase n=1 Tax=Dyella caseinilytica TaxID=1849581 RepID=A0ABX7GQJ1_9GAMM|nr:hypothetical protein [Dyella caseinilytica]QRN52530.1 hypothetical protein ISN74_13765 [Dyella caseinilytica]GGA06802.1 hypothetical protein GCM10011408_29820 [Dyella caseinilytica]